MFSNFSLQQHDRTVYTNLSQTLEEEYHWKTGSLRSFEYILDTSAFAIEPLSGLLAIGTSGGAVHIFGRPGVELKLILPERSGVKFLQFVSSLYRLVCLDDNNYLHVWDLTTTTQPEHLISTKFRDIVNCLTVSPSHSHAFLALQSGEIQTYDLLCLRNSPYTIPNMWTLFEDKMAASGSLTEPNPADHIPIDLVIHPRDLNLVFVAYGGGVILLNLMQRNTLRVYEMVLPPGAPGGSGYNNPNLMSHRRLSVTALAVHPAGHIFVAGYADGSVAFWAVEDEDQPLLVKTIEDDDVNVVDGLKLEAHLSYTETSEKKDNVSGTSLVRESIFKLSWSESPTSTSHWGGETALTILGGIIPGAAVGVTIHWIPVFDLPDLPASSVNQTSLHSVTRDAMRKSLTKIKTCFMSTSGTIQDFWFIPRNSPHFSGAFDPIAVLFLCESDGNTRCTEAYPFPPPSLPPTTCPKSQVPESSNPTDGALHSLDVLNRPRHLRLPSPLLNGSNGVTSGQLLKLDGDAYEKLVSKSEIENDSLPLNGGLAWTNNSMVSELKLSKYQHPRMLITEHCDLTVRFYDISARLLLSSESLPIQTQFPHPLPDLTLDLKHALMDPVVSTRISTTILHQTRFDSVHIASEALECAVILETGETIVYRLDSGPRVETLYREASDKELITLEHVPKRRGRRFYPFLMLAAGKGPLTAFALSDIGFFAASYADGSLLVVDMRAPRIILRYGQELQVKSKPTLSFYSKRHSNVSDPIASLSWTVTTLGLDPQLHVLLVAVHKSGFSEIFTITRPSGSTTWIIESESIKTHTVENPLRGGIFVLDIKTGNKHSANGARLRACLRPSTIGSRLRCILIVAGVKEVKCVAGMTGETLGKAEWGSKVGTVKSVEIVERMGYHALVAFTDKHEVLVHSLPYLKQLHILHLSRGCDALLTGDDTGDFIEWIRHPASGSMMQATYASLFNIRRAYPLPDIDLSSTRPTIPRQPQPVSVGPTSVLSSWFNFGGYVTGEQLDALLAGPDRPPPPSQAQDASSTANNSIAQAAELGQTGLYSRLTSALNERGQMLGDLEERFNSLGTGSKSMLAQAKRLATEQSAKTWFGL